jgi:hypothetical protein
MHPIVDVEARTLRRKGTIVLRNFRRMRKRGNTIELKIVED